MQIIKGLSKIPAFKNPVVTIGSFDGVHLGHQQVLKGLKEEAKKLDGESIVITFDPHPQQVLHQSIDFFLINPIEEKIKLIENEGVDYLIILPFTHEFAGMTFSSFLNEVLVEKIGIKGLVMGPNHSFGKNREGNFDAIAEICKERDIQILPISEFKIDDCAVRSAKIRKLIQDREIEEAEKFLGHDM